MQQEYSSYDEGGGINDYEYRYLSRKAAEYFANRIPIYSTSASRRRSWYADYLEEQKPPQVEIEAEIGFTRKSWFEDGKFRVKRMDIIHG